MTLAGDAFLSGLRRYKTLFARTPIVLVATYSLFIPFLGPLLDHHFAEREPDHYHLYLGQVSPKHVHPYNLPHTHPRDEHHGDMAQDGTSDGIVFLTSDDGLGQESAQFNVSPIHVTLDFPGLEDHLTLSGVPGDETLIQQAFISPPDKPPIT